MRFLCWRGVCEDAIGMVMIGFAVGQKLYQELQTERGVHIAPITRTKARFVPSMEDSNNAACFHVVACS